jgi:hypothetical protein
MQRFAADSTKYSTDTGTSSNKQTEFEIYVQGKKIKSSDKIGKYWY